jgi:hypothetical protein
MSLDYGNGVTNRDPETGISYGVIGQNSLNPDALDSSVEYDYAKGCPKCGGDVVDYDEEKHGEYEKSSTWRTWVCGDYACEACEIYLDNDEVWSEESVGLHSTDSAYEFDKCLDFDLFILRSPYYTFADFCSPCVPGAGNLDSPDENGTKCYALGHDFFDNGVAPYPVYRVSDDTLVESTRDIEDAISKCHECRRLIGQERGLQPGDQFRVLSADENEPINRVIKRLEEGL